MDTYENKYAGKHIADLVLVVLCAWSLYKVGVFQYVAQCRVCDAVVQVASNVKYTRKAGGTVRVRARLPKRVGTGRVLKFIMYVLMWSCGKAATVDQQAVVCCETAVE